MRSKNLADVDKKACAACGACMKECPKEASFVWKGCYATVDVEKCVGCGKCAKVCPVGCIEIRKRGDSA